MALRNILTGDAECLHKVARPVESFDKKLSDLLDDMAETLARAEGVGLAAPQVGISRRVFIINLGDGVMEFVNPQIVSYCGSQGEMEACLSFPGKEGYVVRPKTVVMQAYTRDGSLREYHAEDLFARAVMHENDHLDGKVFLRLVTEPPAGYKKERNRRRK